MFRLFARLGWRLSIPVVLILLGVLFYAGGLVAGFADYMPFNTYSDGWRMGMLSKVSLRGNPLFKSVEGELLMGNDSSATVVKEADEVQFANPWEFSAARSQLPELQQIGGKTVAIHYRQLKLQLGCWRSSLSIRLPPRRAAACKGHRAAPARTVSGSAT